MVTSTATQSRGGLIVEHDSDAGHDHGRFTTAAGGKAYLAIAEISRFSKAPKD